MSFYASHILPRLLDLAMRNREVARYRLQVVPQARGTVVEIGIGSGLNLPFYGDDIERLYGIDPSEELLRMAGNKARSAPFPVELLAHAAEALPLEDRSADTVITTFTLCTITDPVKALQEMRRVLRPSGALLFAEHGLAPDASVERWQHRLNPVWNRISGGCNLDRKIDALIDAAGFSGIELKKEYAKGPRPMSYIYAGRASAPMSKS